MDKIRSAIRLLALFSIFFIYKAIMGVIENNANEILINQPFLFLIIMNLLILNLKESNPDYS